MPKWRMRQQFIEQNLIVREVYVTANTIEEARAKVAANDWDDTGADLDEDCIGSIDHKHVRPDLDTLVEETGA
jgi:hypothetical protein